MEARLIIPLSMEDDDVPLARVVPQQRIAEESEFVPERRIIVSQVVDDDFVLGNYEAVVKGERRRPMSPPAPRVLLGDRDVLGERLEQVAFDLKHRAQSRTKFTEVVRTESCFLASIEDGRYTRSRRIEVDYILATKPVVGTAFSQEELRTPIPIIFYADNACFGSHPFIELPDDTYATDMENEMGVRVDICHKGMSLCMTKEEDHWVYWPMDRDGNIQNFPLCGKVTKELIDAQCVHVSEEPIVHEYMDDSEHLALVIEVLHEEGEKYNLVVVLDTEGQRRAVEIPHTEEFFL